MNGSDGKRGGRKGRGDAPAQPVMYATSMSLQHQPLSTHLHLTLTKHDPVRSSATLPSPVQLPETFEGGETVTSRAGIGLTAKSRAPEKGFGESRFRLPRGNSLGASRLATTAWDVPSVGAAHQRSGPVPSSSVVLRQYAHRRVAMVEQVMQIEAQIRHEQAVLAADTTLDPGSPAWHRQIQGEMEESDEATLVRAIPDRTGTTTPITTKTLEQEASTPRRGEGTQDKLLPKLGEGRLASGMTVSALRRALTQALRSRRAAEEKLAKEIKHAARLQSLCATMKREHYLEMAKQDAAANARAETLEYQLRALELANEKLREELRDSRPKHVPARWAR